MIMTTAEEPKIDASLLNKDGTRLANGFFLPSRSPKSNGRPKGAKGILAELRDAVLDVLLAKDANGLKLIESDIASLKPLDRANIAAKLLPKAYDVALSVADNPVPIVLDALSDDSVDVIEKPAITYESDNGRRSVLNLN